MRLPAGPISKTLFPIAAGCVALFLAVGVVAQDRKSQPDDKSATAAPSISAPDEPIAKKAHDALARRCAGCHQSGRLAPGAAAKGFANVLALEEIAKDPDLIQPGNPDGSRLLIEAMKLQPPHDALAVTGDKPKELAEDLVVIHDWIASLDASARLVCIDRQPIDMRAMLTAIAADVDAQLGRRRKGMRYLTLSHLYNSCASEAAMERFRQGAVKLLNSLSRGAEPVPLRTIDEAKSIIAFNLDDLKWTPADWNRLIVSYPYGERPDTTLYDTVVGQTETPLPWLRADWFAYTTSRAPLYYELLKLPASLAELEKQLGIDSAKNMEEKLVARAGLQSSSESPKGRVIDRHPLGKGYFWTTFDFREGDSNKDLVAQPLGSGGVSGFSHDDAQTLFSLPNGFAAYFLSDREGKRRNSTSGEDAAESEVSDTRIRNAISCFSCHAQGVRRFSDEIKEKVLADREMPAEKRAQVEALYKPVEEMDKLLDQDAKQFADAMGKAGLDPKPGAGDQGLESISFLSRQYAKNLGLRELAGEYGVSPAKLAESLTEIGGVVIALRRRLEQGTVPRRLVESQFNELVTEISGDEPIDLSELRAAVSQPAKPASQVDRVDFDLGLISDKSSYRVGESPVLTISSERDCYLTLMWIDPKGRTEVIFPNKAKRNNFLLEGTLLRYPPEKSRFRLRLNAPGKQTIIARCDARDANLAGGETAFKKLRRSKLGDHRRLLTRQIVTAAKKAGSRDKGADAAKDTETPPIAHSAITFDVE